VARALIPFEILAIVAIAIVWPRLTWSELIPYSLPLVLAASMFRALRGRAREEIAIDRHHVLVGGIAGAVALGLAIVLGTPLVETLSNHAVDWSQFGFVRGNGTQLVVFIIWVTVAAIAAELALRGWIVERALELLPGRAVLPILVGAIAEAALTPGDLGVRLGAGIFGIGVGWMYVAGSRSVVAPICARLIFSVGALLLDGLRIL
jgi:hypothetical protein